MADSFLSRSRQLWKIYAFAWVPLAGAGTVMLGILRLDAGPVPLSLALFFGGIIVALAGGALSAFVIRCPSCGARIFWKALGERGFPGCVGWVMSLQECPACGSDGL